MAPSPAAGKAPGNIPKTPTKLGKSPSSNATSKLGQSTSSADSPKNTAKSTTNTPKSAAKGATDKAKGSTPSKTSTNSPKLPPRPKGADQAASKAKDAAPDTKVSDAPKAPAQVEDVKSKTDDAKGKIGDTQEQVDDTKDEADDEAEETGNKIGLQDNEPTDDDTDAPQGKISQAGNDTAEESSAVSTADDADDAIGGAQDTVEEGEETETPGLPETEDIKTPDAPDTEEAEEAEETGTGAAKDAASGAKGLTDKATDTAGGVKDAAEKGDASGTATGAKDGTQEVAEEATDNMKDAAPEEADETVEKAKGAKDEAEDATEDAKDKAGEAADEAGEKVDGVKDEAEGTIDEAEDKADGAKDGVEGAADEEVEDVEGAVPDADAADAVDGVKEDAEDAAEALPVDLSVLKGLEVGEGGEILDAEGEPIGKVEEGDPEDLIGMTIGDDGEILDDDGDVIGRCGLLPGKAEELADQAPVPELPEVEVLKGLEVGEEGNILGPDGTPLGKLVDGDPSELLGKTLNENGEIVDEEGNVIGRAEVVPGEAADKINAAKGEAEDAVDVPDVEELQAAAEEAREAAEEARAAVPDLIPDLSILEGRKINKKGKILDDEGEPIGQLTEDSDFKECVGKKPNEKGEVLNAKGDVVGTVEVIPGEAADEAMKALHPEKVEQLEEAQKAAEEAEAKVEEAEEALAEAKAAAPETPDISTLEGLKVNKKGLVLDEDGEPIARVSEGELADVAGKKINAQGEIVDKDGNVIGKVEMIKKEPEETEVKLPELSILEGLKVNKKGEVVNEDGDPIARLSEGELSDAVGKKINDNGEVIDKDGKVVGKVELIREAFLEEAPAEGEEAAPDAAEEAAPEVPRGPDLSILDGLKVNKKGEVINEDGDLIAKLSEGELSEVAGKKINGKGEVLDKDGNVIGKVELTQEVIDEQIEAGDALPAEPEGQDMSILEGYRVNKKGEVVNEDGEVIATLVEGDLTAVAGRKVNDKGEITDKEGNVIGKVQLVEQQQDEQPDEGETEPELPPLSILEGLKCNKSGKIINDEGVPVGELIEGDAKKLSKMGTLCDDQGQFWDSRGHVIGKAVTLMPEESEEEGMFAGLEGLIVVQDGFVEDENGNKVGKIVEGDEKKLVGRSVDEDGDVIDKRGNVVGHAERYEEPEPQEETGPELPPLSILEGLKCNKSGKIVNAQGTPVGELVEGDVKKISKSGALCDAEGQFWDGKGHVIGKAVTLPEEDSDEDGPFAGLEGLIVVQDGFVEDENNNKVGKLVEGDEKKLVGRSVDEDGDVLDKRGNVVGHAERYEEEVVEPEEEKPIDYSILKDLTVNKQGNVIGPSGVPIARLAEGNLKECQGRKCDENGSVYNDSGKKIGQCEIIPEEQREVRQEGPFAGLEGLHVVKDGMVEDAEGNTVGQVVEGDPKRLIGREVDEDGDIIDRYGNVKGHAEPYEEEPEPEVDLSSLEGCTVNKAGNVVDDNGHVRGRIVDGDPKELAGKKVDGQGQIWSANGKVIGHATITDDGGNKAEGPFAGFESAQVGKDGIVYDAAQQVIGRVIEGDPQKLLGRKVDPDGDILDSNGNPIGKAERWQEEEKERHINPMSGRKVNKEGNVYDADGNHIGKLTEGKLENLVGCEIDDNGYVVDNDGNRIGECTLLENIPDAEPEPEPEYTEEELEAMRQKEEDRQIAVKMNSILTQTLDKIEPVLKQITEVFLVLCHLS